MKNKTKAQMKNINLVLEIVITLLLSITAVSAFAVGGPDVIQAYPGQTQEQVFELQNILENSANLTVRGQIEKGSEVISFKENMNNLKVPANKIILFTLKIKVPSNTPVGTEYPSIVRFNTLTTSAEQGGSVSFAINAGKQFKVIVIEKPANAEPEKSNNTTLIVIVLIVIILALIIWLVLRKKKNGANQKNIK